MPHDAPAPRADRPALAEMAWRLTHVLGTPLNAAARRLGVPTGEYLELLAWEVQRRDDDECRKARQTSDVKAVGQENRSAAHQERAARDEPVDLERVAGHENEILARHEAGEAVAQLAIRHEVSTKTVGKLLARLYLTRMADRDAA